MKKSILLLILLSFILDSKAQHQLPPVFGSAFDKKTATDSRVRTYLTPQRIVWQSDGVEQSNLLLSKGSGQSEMSATAGCILRNDSVNKSSLILDFGKELHGGIRIIRTLSGGQKPIKVRIILGESVSETLSSIGHQNATNDHAFRDFETELLWLGSTEVGNSGFRFARIELLEPNTSLSLKEVSAVFTYRNIPYLGSFQSNNQRLNDIWLTGAYTVHLNMQEYLWDGIKRDRLVWVGDMHPEVMTINYVFGYNDVVPKSLDLVRDITPLPGWMNGFSSYSLWWILIHNDWYRYQGNLDYLKQQQSYLTALLQLVMSKVDDEGKEHLDGIRFLDWPSEANRKGVDAGLHALLIRALDAGHDMCLVLNETELATKCAATTKKMKQNVPEINHSKQAAALMALANLIPATKANNEVIAIGGAQNFSTFYGYYMLQAQAKAGAYSAALSNISDYWGAMLDMGATTFWEDFDLAWLANAAPIDQLVPVGKKDIHGDYGAYCYKQFRHSLCHGWASGPTAWLSEHVLGVKVLEPGCKLISITPHLADLEWVKGTFPTPYGVVNISHKKVNGKVQSTVTGPKEVKIIMPK